MEGGYQGIDVREAATHQILLKPEKSKMKGKDINIDTLRKEKPAAEKTLGAKQTAKERLVWKIHSLKERLAKQKSSAIDPMKNIWYIIRYNQKSDSRSTACNLT